MAREDPQFKLRMPEDLHTRIAEEAEKSGRSMNAEIVKRLADSLGPDDYRDVPMFSSRSSAASADVPIGVSSLVRVSEFAAAVERFNSLTGTRGRTKDQDEALERIIARWGDPPTWERGRST